MLEGACHELDFKLAMSDASTFSDDLSATLKQLHLTREELESQQNWLTVLTEMLTFTLLTVEDAYNNPVYVSLKDDIDSAQKIISDKVIYIKTYINKIKFIVHYSQLKSPSLSIP